MFPDLFRRHLSVSIDGDVVDCVGNMFLLRRPMMAVHLRRRWTDAEKEQYKAMCISAAAQGIVPVSPFVSPVENEIRKCVLDAGGAVIHIVDHGFDERFKPSGKSMDTCAEGRLLLVAESGAAVRGEKMSYRKSSRLNALAARLAALTPASAIVLKGGRRLPPQ